MTPEKIKIVDTVKGFNERDANSKAILNTDIDSFLRYKIQKKKFSDINKSTNELNFMKNEIDCLKNDLIEIKQLLLQITKK
jgi:hypothetical protein